MQTIGRSTRLEHHLVVEKVATSGIEELTNVVQAPQSVNVYLTVDRGGRKFHKYQAVCSICGFSKVFQKRVKRIAMFYLVFEDSSKVIYKKRISNTKRFY